MAKFTTQYAALIAVTTGVFLTFVACGSQFYKVTLDGDSGPRTTSSRTNTQNPQSKGAESRMDSDPKSNWYAIHAPGGWVEKPVHYRLDPRMAKAQMEGIQKAMRTWELAVGKNIFAYDGVQASVNGDSFKDLYSSLDDHVNGLYLDNDWAKTGKDHIVLATTIWDNDPSDLEKIMTADMRYNNNDYVFGDSLVIWPEEGREVVDLQTVATHELGHFLGLNHVDAKVDPDSIMVAALYIGQGVTQRTISRDDIRRMHKIYGCSASACDVEATLLKIDEFVKPSDE